MANKKLAFINLKGGVGKTTLSVNFAAHCGATGKKVLLIDFDPQTNATLSCMKTDDWTNHASTKGTIANVFGLRNHSTAEGAEKKIKDVIVKNVFKNVDLLPSHLELFSIDLELGGRLAKETIIQRALEESGLEKNYDLIICDCPPNLAVATQNAIALCDHYLIPVLPDYLSMVGIALLIKQVANFSKELRHPIENLGIAITKYPRNSDFREGILSQIEKSFKGLTFSTKIADRSSISEAASKQKSIFQMTGAPAKKAKDEFRELFDEILTKLYPVEVKVAPVRKKTTKKAVATNAASSLPLPSKSDIPKRRNRKGKE